MSFSSSTEPTGAYFNSLYKLLYSAEFNQAAVHLTANVAFVADHIVYGKPRRDATKMTTQCRILHSFKAHKSTFQAVTPLNFLLSLRSRYSLNLLAFPSSQTFPQQTCLQRRSLSSFFHPPPLVTKSLSWNMISLDSSATDRIHNNYVLKPKET